MRKLDEDQKTEIKEKISDYLGVDMEEIVEDAHIRNDLGADSLDEIEILMKMENLFNINIPDNDFEEVETVSDLFKVIERYY